MNAIASISLTIVNVYFYRLMSKKEILTIGILAHVDAGKTSLTESLLYKSGATKALGSVDKGSAITDGLEIPPHSGNAYHIGSYVVRGAGN